MQSYKKKLDYAILVPILSGYFCIFCRIHRIFTFQIPFERIAAAMQVPGNTSFADSVPKRTMDIRIVSIQAQVLLRLSTPSWPSQCFTLGFQSCQCLFGTLRNQVAFDFRTQSKGERQHFRLDVVTQPITIFYRPHTALAPHAQAQNFHDHEQTTPQATEFATDYRVALANTLQ